MEHMPGSIGASPLARRTLLQWLLLPLALAGCSGPHVDDQQAIDLFVATDGDLIAFTPDTLTCPSGARVRLTFHHAGRFLSARHDWMLTFDDKLEALSQELLDHDGEYKKGDPRIMAVTPLADKGGTVMTSFTAPAAGEYPFLCSTHPEDMRGILHVTAHT
jgi:plastocyanin